MARTGAFPLSTGTELVQCHKPLMSMGVSHTNSRSVRIGDLGFSPMDRGQLDGSGSVKTFDLTFLHVGHGCVKAGKRATSRPHCMRLRAPPPGFYPAGTSGGELDDQGPAQTFDLTTAG